MSTLEHGDIVYDVDFLNDGAALATACRDGSVTAWDARSGAVVWRSAGVGPPAVGVRCSPGGDVLAAISDESDTVVVIDARTGNELRRWSFPGAQCLAFSPGGEELLVGSTSAGVGCWDVSSGAEKSPPPWQAGPALALRFSRSGRFFLVSTRGGFRIFRWPERVVAGSIDFERCSVYDALMLQDDKTCVASLHFHRDGPLGTTEDCDLYEIGVWQPLREEFRAEETLLGHAAHVAGLDVSADGRHLVSASADATICLWDLDFRSLLVRSREHRAFVRAARFAPDGRLIASASLDGTVKLWDVAQATAGGVPPEPPPPMTMEGLLERLGRPIRPGRDEPLLAGMDVAEILLATTSPFAALEQLHETFPVDLLVMERYNRVGWAMAQVLNIRVEQAHRERDEGLAARCVRAQQAVAQWTVDVLRAQQAGGRPVSALTSGPSRGGSRWRRKSSP